MINETILKEIAALRKESETGIGRNAIIEKYSFGDRLADRYIAVADYLAQKEHENAISYNTALNEIDALWVDFKPSEKLDEAPAHLVLDSNLRCGLIINDLHIPYHNRDAIIQAIKIGVFRNVDFIIINGDLIDCYPLSRYEKDKNKRSFDYELKETRSFLNLLRKTFPNTAIYYKFGNHEFRHQKYINEKAPELGVVDELRLDKLLRLETFGIEYVPQNQLVKIGDTFVVHGHESMMFFKGGVAAARNTLLAVGENVVMAHLHRSQTFTETFLTKTIKCNVIPSLCDLNPAYIGYSKWQNGCGIIEQSSEICTVENIEFSKLNLKKHYSK
jgi:predicted phosphodiesterase